jgi:hypothetical protein
MTERWAVLPGFRTGTPYVSAYGIKSWHILSAIDDFDPGNRLPSAGFGTCINTHDGWFAKQPEKPVDLGWLSLSGPKSAGNILYYYIL